MISREQLLLHHSFTFENIIPTSVCQVFYMLIFAMAQEHKKIPVGRAKFKQTNAFRSFPYDISIFTPSKLMETSFLHKAIIGNTNLKISQSF